MPDLPSINKDCVLACTAYCNGSKLKDTFSLVSATVRTELNRIGKATLKFNTGNMDKQTFDESDDSLFKPGNTIRLDAGSTDKEEILFEGIIIGLRILTEKDHHSYMVIECRDKLKIKKPNVGASPVHTVTFGADITAFDLELSSDDQFSQYEAVSWNPEIQKAVKASATAPSLNQQGDLQPENIASGNSLLLQTDAPNDEKALKQWADSMALRAGLARYQGSVSFYGSAKVVPGCIIELKGMGKRFNGNLFVGSVTHTLENNEWITQAGAGVSPLCITSEDDVVSPSASGFLPGLQGLHAAVVKKLDGDPLKEQRIQVELPWMDGKSKLLWARLSTMYATNAASSFFLPEPEDEVIIGFMNQDPALPVILGSLYGEMHKSPYEYEAKNNKKAIVTREKLRIEFDEEKKIITVSTPGNNTVELSDDGKHIHLTDANKNEIKMDSNGITLSSAKDITLKAKGNITLDATMKLNGNAKQDISLDGLNVKVQAKVGATVTGNAMAELSASGQTIVKGAMVMIN